MNDFGKRILASLIMFCMFVAISAVSYLAVGGVVFVAIIGAGWPIVLAGAIGTGLGVGIMASTYCFVTWNIQ